MGPRRPGPPRSCLPLPPGSPGALGLPLSVSPSPPPCPPGPRLSPLPRDRSWSSALSEGWRGRQYFLSPHVNMLTLRGLETMHVIGGRFRRARAALPGDGWRAHESCQHGFGPACGRGSGLLPAAPEGEPGATREGSGGAGPASSPPQCPSLEPVSCEAASCGRPAGGGGGGAPMGWPHHFRGPVQPQTLRLHALGMARSGWQVRARWSP